MNLSTPETLDYPWGPARSPQQRHSAAELLISGFRPFADPPRSADPLQWPDYREKLTRAREHAGSVQAVTAGTALIDGQPCVAIAFNFDFLGGSMGEAEGDLIVRAIEEAARNRQPLVSVAQSGGARMQEGTVSLIQMSHIARALVTLAAAETPHIAVIDDPTTGGVWAALTAAADVIVARAGAQVAFAGSRVRSEAGAGDTASNAEGKHSAGFVDVLCDDENLPAIVGSYVHLLSPLTRGDCAQPDLPRPARGAIESDLQGWDSVIAARSPSRQTSEQYLGDYFESTQPLSGDRAGGVDSQLACGFGRRNGRTVAFICQLGGTAHPSGFRTARRVLALAERLRLPVITLIDTSGADNSPQGELLGIGTSIAEVLQQLAATTVPVLSIVVGQGVSGGAIALVNPDNLWMAPDSYLAVIAPESAANILKQDVAEVPAIARRLSPSPRDIVALGLARGIIG
ncbi:MAG: acetyl-CoA carboxylase [Actinomycetota bacterium]|nr:acetyl-CoA carboxylase [Actinomycetota bacterium]